jgi:hypothetical protein
LFERRRFGREALLDVLSEVSASLEGPVEAYLIGGLAMMQSGLKAATKDVDVVFMDEADERAFESALRSLGFDRPREVSDQYDALGATRIVEGPDGMRFDIFVEVVCRKLRLTEGMRGRAEELPLDGNLRLMALAPEDLFLFKSVTERDDDLADMALLAGLALDWQVMSDEIMGDPVNRRYLAHYVVKLDELEEVHGVAAPGRQELREEAEVIVAINRLGERLAEGPLTILDAARFLGEGEAFCERMLDRMVLMGIAREDDGSFHRAE